MFDGHVGKNAAERAKVLFPEEFAKNLRGHEDDANMALVLRKTFLSTDARMIEFDMEGATATGVYIWRAAGRRFIQSANVGDSTAFLWSAPPCSLPPLSPSVSVSVADMVVAGTVRPCG